MDVAIAGGGAAGIMTALRASENPDLVVAVFEKSTREGSNAAISSGSLAAGGTRFQRAAGIEDSPARHAADILAASGDEDWRPVVEALCSVAPLVVEWIADSGYPVEIGVDLSRAGMSAPRLHSDVGRLGGGRLMRHLRALLEARPNVAFVDEAPGAGLLTHGGRVTGLAVVANGERQEVRAAATVLAMDGFAGNRSLVAEHLAALGDPFYGGVATSSGDALPWLTELGAPLRNMGAALRSGLVVVGHGTRVSPGLPFNGAVLVNQRGERFVDEQAHGYSALSGILQQQPGEKACLIWDATAMTATRDSEPMRQSLAAGAITGAATLPQLAVRLGLSEAATASALTPVHDRRALKAPYHVAWVTHGVLASQGGAVIDTGGRVLDATDRAIPGLYAAGGTACGLAGPSSDGYLSGNGLLGAFGMGWIVGNTLASLENGALRASAPQR